jgi:hypothetical protein
MSEAQRRRGTWPPAAGRPWTAEEDELARTLPVRKAAAAVCKYKSRGLLRLRPELGDLLDGSPPFPVAASTPTSILQ